MHFPVFQPIQKAHAEQIGFHLSARHHERRYRTLDELADGKAVERSAGPPGARRRSTDVDVILQQLQRQSGGPCVS